MSSHLEFCRISLLLHVGVRILIFFSKNPLSSYAKAPDADSKKDVSALLFETPPRLDFFIRSKKVNKSPSGASPNYNQGRMNPGAYSWQAIFHLSSKKATQSHARQTSPRTENRIKQHFLSAAGRPFFQAGPLGLTFPFLDFSSYSHQLPSFFSSGSKKGSYDLSSFLPFNPSSFCPLPKPYPNLHAHFFLLHAMGLSSKNRHPLS